MKLFIQTFIDDLYYHQYINYNFFTIHYLQYITYDTLFKKSCLQLNPTIIKLFTMQTLIEYYITDISYFKFIILNISFPKTCKWSLVFFQTWRKVSSSPSPSLPRCSSLLLLGTYVAGTSAQRFVSLLSSDLSENVYARKIRIQRVSIARSNRLCDFRPISINFVKWLYILIIFLLNIWTSSP